MWNGTIVFSMCLQIFLSLWDTPPVCLLRFTYWTTMACQWPILVTNCVECCYVWLSKCQQPPPPSTVAVLVPPWLQASARKQGTLIRRICTPLCRYSPQDSINASVIAPWSPLLPRMTTLLPWPWPLSSHVGRSCEVKVPSPWIVVAPMAVATRGIGCGHHQHVVEGERR